MHQPRARTALAPWPPDDTEESVLGTHYHQDAITNARTGINEVAIVLAVGGDPPFRADGQTLITGMRHPDGSPYRVFPDVFVYPFAFDMALPSMDLRRHGPPSLAVEVLSDWNWHDDVDMAAGKDWTYAGAGIAEYLILDPLTSHIGVQGQGWRLEGGRYTPWAPDAHGRWMSALGFGLGFEGVLLAVCDAEGREVPREGHILRSLAESRASGLAEGEARGLAEGLLVGRLMLLHLLARRFGPPPPELEARVARLDAAILPALTDAALDVASLTAFVQALDRLERQLENKDLRCGPLILAEYVR